MLVRSDPCHQGQGPPRSIGPHIVAAPLRLSRLSREAFNEEPPLQQKCDIDRSVEPRGRCSSKRSSLGGPNTKHFFLNARHRLLPREPRYGKIAVTDH